MHAYMYIKFIIHKIFQNLIKLESCTLPPPLFLTLSLSTTATCKIVTTNTRLTTTILLT